MRPSEGDTVETLVAALVHELERGLRLLHALSDDQFVTGVEDLELRAIGAHQRHVLDACEALLAGVGRREIAYDRRRRDRRSERDRALAIARTEAIIAALQRLPASDTRLGVRDAVDPSEAPPETASSLSRELLYLFEHVVHHHALMKVCALALGVRL
ncbi:MAG: hypothetical protein ACK4N5_23600, partial [Myxococcales bacterium]